MKSLSKNNWKIEEDETEHFTRYGIRKYNVGAASVAILSGLFFLAGGNAQASDNNTPKIEVQAQTVQSNSNSPSNTWERAIATVVEKNNTSVSSTVAGTKNKNPEVVKESEIGSTVSPKEITPEKVELLKEEGNKTAANSQSRSARRVREVGSNPDEAPTASQPTSGQPTTNQPEPSQPATNEPAASQPTGSQPTSTQPKPSGEYAGTEIKAYYDNNHNGVFDEGDELISSTVIPPAPKGENGNDGKDAVRGAELLSGIIAPTPEDGKNGDTYIDATTGDVYKKRNGAWGKIGNIRGPQGEQGQKVKMVRTVELRKLKLKI